MIIFTKWSAKDDRSMTPCISHLRLVRNEKIGYNINVLRQTACLVVNPIKVNSFAYLFNCTTVGRTSDVMTVPSLTLLKSNTGGW